MHAVEVVARVRRLRHKRHFLKKKGAAGFVHDGVPKNDCIPDIVHLSGYGQRLADSEAKVSAVQAR